MNKINLETKTIICEIEGEDSDIAEIIKDDFTYHYLLGGKLTQNSNFDVRVSKDSNIKKFIDLKYPEIRYNNLYDSREIVVLTEYLAERARQEKKGYYSLSSACASLDNRAIVFFGGATHLGKTSSMLTLVKKKNFDFVSDEKTLLDLANLEIIPGAVSIPLRKEILRKKFFHLESPEFVKMDQKDRINNAALFIYPHLDSGLSEPIFYKFKPLDFFWLLTRELSGVIRGSVRMVNNFSYLLPSLDTEELAQERVARTKHFCEKVPCYYFQGSLEQVQEYIPKLVLNP
jgi:hypothetical protein